MCSQASAWWWLQHSISPTALCMLYGVHGGNPAVFDRCDSSASLLCAWQELGAGALPVTTSSLDCQVCCS